MKKYLLIPFMVLALCWPCTAGMIQKAKKKATGASCDSCTGNTIQTWHAENSADVTSGTPCGCADSDTIGTASDTPTYSGTSSDGDYSFVVNETDEHVAYDATMGNTFTFCQKMRATFSGFSDSTEILSWEVTGSTVYAVVYLYGYDTNTVDLRLRISESTVLTDSNIPVSDDTWMSACMSIDTGQAAGSDQYWVWLDGDGDGVMDADEYSTSSAQTLDDNIAASGVIRVGAGGCEISGGADFLVDDFYVDNQFRSAAFTW